MPPPIIRKAHTLLIRLKSNPNPPRRIAIAIMIMPILPLNASKTSLPRSSTSSNGHYFNAEKDSLRFDSPLVGFDMTQVMEDDVVFGSLASYVFHGLFNAMRDNQGGFAVIVDEFPRYLKSKVFLPYVEIILQEIRKLHGIGLFAAQDAETVFNNEFIASKLKANIAGYLLFPDPQADSHYYCDIMGLNDQEFAWICEPHHRKVMFKRKSGESSILNIDLSCLGKHLSLFDSSAHAVQRLNTLKKDHQDDALANTFIGI